MTTQPNGSPTGPARADPDTLFRAGLAVCGVAMLITGIVAVFVTENEIGAAALLGIGAALGVVAYGGQRLTRLSAGGVELELARASAFEEAAAVADARGDSELAEELRARGMTRLREVARSYEGVRRSMPPGAERTQRMESLFSDARMQARTTPPTETEVRALFRGDDGDRIAAIGAMYEHGGLRDFELLMDAVDHSRSAYEQYHALALLDELIPELDEAQQSRLEQSINAQRELPGRIGPQSDRWRLTDGMLRKLA